ncbi:peptidoglycan DD-metalloendopeptidase family protein [Microbacterium sp. EST19A]|uniref:peptidoglycan DD-metalloendopeptidase family protein n=1 Tax=Microbacterium sp. EST19A TaxID=2862681 RepID=UPI001CBE1B7D|nr:peptidoglycan DD-metalloendopeptidase family protein [Microbacterium sp. EST19A]
MPFENPQAASAPTRRTSRLRTAASEAPAAGPTESVAAAEATLALAAVAPLSRRAARQRHTVETPIDDAPLAPVDDAPAENLASDADDASLETDKVEELIEVSEPVDEPETVVAPEAFEMPAAAHAPAEDATDEDAFERASRAFRTTGPVPTASADAEATADQPDVEETIAADAAGPSSHVATRRPRNARKLLAVGATVGVMSLAGLLAVSMTLPAEAVAAVQGGSPISATSLVTASAATADGTAKDEIQAFVAPSGVENESLARADDFSTISLVQVAAEQGINYSNEVFTNDPEAAIQWPFMVGVGMSYGYGMRSGRLHEGIDFVPGNGAPVQAIADGTVRIATEQGGAYGVTVYIDHVIDGSVITSHYSHMQYGSLQVTQGQTVKVGQIVGKTGNTGRSYGAHMHFELIVNGSTIDPLPWLRENAGRYSY